ncbi:MAG: lipid-A-disaccharide synthase [Terriglobales bacterium]
MQILISAGEASGEMYGAQLIEALRLRDPALTFFGAGGERMRAAGCDIVVDAKDLAVVGITEVVSHLPKILRLYKKLIRAANDHQPALAVVIDSPAFNWRVARQMRKRGTPVVYYVCPQFWAWRQGRVTLLRKYVNKALVIFPFEEKFYRDRGVDATFVGHPLADLPMPAITREDYAAQHSLDPAKPWITLMPGSRRKEVRMNLPVILEAAVRLGSGYEFLLPVARTLEASFFEGLIRDCLNEAFIEQEADPQGLKPTPSGTPSGAAEAVPYSNPRLHLVPDALPALRHARAAIVASGTATVEAALMETPFVMVYRVSPLTYALGKPRVKVPHLAMVNLIAGDRIVPELVQRNFTAENIVAELGRIIPDGPDRETMIRDVKSVREKLKKPYGAGHSHADQAPTHAADRAAEIILQMLK